MSVKRLTDEECDDIRAEVGIKFAGPFGQFYERDLMRAAWSRGLQRAAEELRRAAPNEGYVRTCMLAMADRFDREREGADGK